MKFFIKFSGRNTTMSVISDTWHTQRTFPIVRTVCAQFRQFWHPTPPSPLWSALNKLAQYRHTASASSSLPFPHPSSSSPEETFNLLDGEISGFTSLLSIFTKGLIGLIVPQERGPVLFFSFCRVLCFSQRDLRQVHFLPASVNFIPFSFSSSTVYGETFMFFAKPGPEELASLVPCFYIEDSGLRLAALTALRVEVLCVAEADGVGNVRRLGKSQGATVGWLDGEQLVLVYFFSKSPNVWYPIMGDNRGPHIRSSTFWN